MSHPLTRQEVFNQVVEMLAAREWARAVITVTLGTSCRYRSPIGPCAIGHFLTDEEYTNVTEGVPAAEIISSCSALSHFTSAGDIVFLSYLQAAHDAGVTSWEMKQRLAMFARQYGLECPVEIDDEYQQLVR